jgi:hypothetical protein
MEIVKTRFALGRYWKDITLVYDIGRIFFTGIGFNKTFNSEVKMMEGRQYHGYDGAPNRAYVIEHFGKDKMWSCADTPHNAFHISFLKGEKPYARWKEPLVDCEITRPLYEHQCVAKRFIITRRQLILAGEMGVGKTLAEIESRELVNPDGAWYVAPLSALKAVKREQRKWDSHLLPEMMTYQGLVKRVREMEGLDIKPPQWMTLDESSCVKNPTSQRSQAAYIMANAMREFWGEDCYIVLMTGSPAPKSPLDWWMQCEIARPGYLIEGDINKFRQRLAILVDRDFGGGVHKHIAAWRDRENICDTCGLTEDDPIHNPEMAEVLEEDDEIHTYTVAVNEVKKLYDRMDGLVLVQLKKDCLDLPDKRFEEINLEPTKKIIQIARTLVRSAPTVAEGLARLRTLSDGFQYEDEKTGTERCPICNGAKMAMDWELKEEFVGEALPPCDYPTEDEINETTKWDEFEDPYWEACKEAELEWKRRFFDFKLMECVRCSGAGIIDTFTRTSREVFTPKEAALKELIEKHTEVGRLVTYAGFQGAVDRVEKIYQSMEWATIKWDGRGIKCSIPDVDPLDLFQDMKGVYPRVGFIGQPGAAGMGLTLTASPGCVYWSNTFNAVDRIQSVDRIHRLGMDTVRGATIYDLLHLPTDYLVLNNIKEKIARQDLTMGLDIRMEDVLNALAV